jgi:hypothetical protein
MEGDIACLAAIPLLFFVMAMGIIFDLNVSLLIFSLIGDRLKRP